LSNLLGTRIPKNSIGYVLILCGILFIIISLINIPRLTGFSFLLTLGQVCLILGIAGIYYRKIKNCESFSKSLGKDGIEQENLSGTKRTILLQEKLFRLITIVGILFTSLYFIIIIIDNYFITKLPQILFMMIFGYFLLISGLLIIFYNKKITNKF